MGKGRLFQTSRKYKLQSLAIVHRQGELSLAGAQKFFLPQAGGAASIFCTGEARSDKEIDCFEADFH